MSISRALNGNIQTLRERAEAAEAKLASTAHSLAPEEIQALGWVSDRHPHQSLELEVFLDDASIGWLHVKARQPLRGSSRIVDVHYIVSPRGRVWSSTDGRRRGIRLHG